MAKTALAVALLTLSIILTGLGTGLARPARQLEAAARNGKIAFADDLGQLQVVALDGSAVVIAHCPRSLGGCTLEHAAWSPDGRQIAYVSGSVGLPPSGPFTLSLYIQKATSRRARRLSDCGICATQYQGAGLAWSPDGSRIAFSRDAGPPSAQSLWLVDTTTGDLRRLTDCQPQPCVDISPAWAPNGQLIAFSRLSADGSSLYTVRPDGSQLTKITSTRFAEHPQWSPDGRRIAFDGDDKVFVIDANGSHETLLFAGTTGNGPGMPAWSPDGRKIAYFNTPREPNRLFDSEVWTINPDGTARKRLYHSICCVMNWAPPIWSPDGRKLAFATTSARAVFVINRDGSHLHRISSASTSALSWQRLP